MEECGKGLFPDITVLKPVSHRMASFFNTCKAVTLSLGMTGLLSGSLKNRTIGIEHGGIQALHIHILLSLWNGRTLNMLFPSAFNYIFIFCTHCLYAAWMELYYRIYSMTGDVLNKE